MSTISTPFFDNVIARWTKVAISKVAIIKTKSAAIVFFFSSPLFLLVALFFSFPFVFRYYDFGASWAQETCLLTLFSHKWLQISLGWFSKNRLDREAECLISPNEDKLRK